ncbi:hypothetical protein Tco_1142489 [Tanacetum coccineum]
MKLNPKKCTFGAVEGMFLGHVVNEKQIKECQEKAEAVTKLQSLRTLKEVHSLNGKLASLNRFLSKSAEKPLPFFKTLKRSNQRGVVGRKRLVTNDNLLRQAHIASSGDQLQLHVKTYDGTIACNEKVEEIFPRPSGCGHHGPTNQANLIKTRELWENGKMGGRGPGTALILKNPEGMEFTYALRFEFDASNNEAEYEPLIFGLRVSLNYIKSNKNVIGSKPKINQARPKKKVHTLHMVQEKTQLSRSRCMNSLREVKSQFKFLSETLQDFGTMPIFKRTFSQDLDLLEQHLTKDILSQTECNTTLTKLRTKFENAFNSKFKERMQKYIRFNAQSFQDAMICNMDSIGKYMCETILHQQRTPQLLKQKKLMQTQDHSNPIQALNVNSLKVDLVVIQNTFSEKEDTNSETAFSKSVKESSLDSVTKDVHAIKYKMSKVKERCMAYFRSLHSHLQVLSKEDLKGTRIEHGFKRAFMSLFGQDYDTFTSIMLLNLQTQESKIDTGKAVDADLVITESSGTKSKLQDESSRSGNDTDADDADIRPIYDEEPIAEVQLTAECNIFAIGQQHTEQPEISNEGRVDQYPEQCQVKSPMLDSSPDNQTTDYSKQSLESENILLKKTVAQFQKDFSRMEAHCIALELKYQNQALKSGQHGQILNEISNKAKIKKEIDVLETMNIEFEHSVAKLRKENETLKKHYKDLYDYIKIMRSKTIEQKTSLLANNADLKAQIQEKAFAIAALKNELRKLKGNSVDTKVAKTSVLGKLVLQSLRNQSVVR